MSLRPSRAAGGEPGEYRFFASCARGLEELLATDLRTHAGVEPRVAVAGVQFTATLAEAYRLCLWSRIASRVFVQLAEIPAADAPQLLAGVTDQPWELHIPPGATFAIDFSGTSTTLRNTLFNARCVKDGIVDRLRALTGARPDVDVRAPDVRVSARLHRDRVTLGIDLCGDALHRRGYRGGTGAAPLKESLAAAVLLRGDWPRIAAAGGMLFDPACGSGTLLIEGAAMAQRQAPGLTRDLAAQRWPGHDRAAWDAACAEARAQQLDIAALPRLLGADADGRVLGHARENAGRAGVAAAIHFEQAPLARVDTVLDGGAEAGLLVCNPPYGERMGEVAALKPLYADLGRLVRERASDWNVAILTVDGPLVEALGLRFTRRYKVFNGAIECCLLVRDPERARRREARTEARLEALAAAEEAGIAELSAPLGEGARMVANRLQKNLRRLQPWLRTGATDCYRVYDADIPEYAVAIDRYGDWVHIAEYAPPASVDPARAEARLKDVRAAVLKVLGVAPGRIVLKQRTRQRGKQQYERLARDNNFLEVREGRARLLVNLRDFLDTGLFLDHRAVRRQFGALAAGKRVLNLFCYTATATVQAALGGAQSSVSVDMSATYLDWARRNLTLNGFAPAAHELVQADVLTWLRQETRRWDLIFLDPPSFSNSKRMTGTLDVQRDHAGIIRLALARLAPGGTLLFSTNRRGFRLDAEALGGLAIEDLTAASLDPDFDRPRVPHQVFRIAPATGLS